MDNGSNYKRLEGTPVQQSGGLRPSHAGEIWDYLEILRRKWWLVVGAGLVALSVAWWQERGAVPVYTAQALLEQRREAPLVGTGIGGVPVDFGSQVELIRSRAVAETVVDSLGLQLQLLERHAERGRIIRDIEVDPEVRSASYTLLRDGSSLILLAGEGTDTIATSGLEDWVDGPSFRFRVADADALERQPLRFAFRNRQASIERLQRSIHVEPGRGPALIRIHYTDPDAIMAAAIVNTVAVAYQQHRAEAARVAASRRREVIAGQIVEMADSLDAAQDLIVDYQRGAGSLDPGFEGGRLATTVLDTESELRTLRFQESLLASLVAGLSGDDARQDQSIHGILSLGGQLVPAGPALHNRLQELEIERSRLTASRFGRTEGDPQVEVIDSLIVATKGQMRIAAQQGLDHIRVRIRGAEDRLATLRGELGGIPGRTAELTRLRQRASAVQDVVDALVDRYFEAQIAEGVEAGDIVVVDAAPVPLWPDRSQRQLKYMFSLIAGLMLGVFGTFGLAYLDTRVRRAGDARVATGLPLLGMVPQMVPSKGNAVAAAIGREAFRALRTNLRFGVVEEPRVLSLTSATPKDGKTTVAVNLARTLGEQSAEAVLLIDADLRQPMVHRVFGLDPKPGLTDVLKGTAQPFDAIRGSLPHPNLHVLPCGSRLPNPAEALGSAAFQNLLEELKTRYSYIVIDSPPVLAVTDGVLITKVVDGTIVVVRANHTDRAAVSSAMDQLRQVNASLLGVILNAVDLKSGDGRQYYKYSNDYLKVVDEEADPRDRLRLLAGSAGDGRA